MLSEIIIQIQERIIQARAVGVDLYADGLEAALSIILAEVERHGGIQ